MEDEILNTIESLTTRANNKEEEVNKLKKLINELCGEAGVPIRYPTIIESGGANSLRSDQFYGLPLTAAIRNYLEIRKAAGLGAASVAEIFRAVRDGGYKFDTRNEDNARIGVGNALRKTSSIFHRLPTGHYGLLNWYPSAKVPTESNGAASAKHRATKKKKGVKKRGKVDDGDTGGPTLMEPTTALVSPTVTNAEVRDVILAQTGTFEGGDIKKALKEQFPAKKIPLPKISTMLFLLKGKGILAVVTARSGKKGATYRKA
jgi:hypothetical protein